MKFAAGSGIRGTQELLPCTPFTPGTRITVSVIAAATSDDSFPFPVRDESINPAAAAMLFSSSCASAAYRRISAAVMTG